MNSFIMSTVASLRAGWPHANDDSATDGYRPLTIQSIDRETATIRSYWLAHPGGLPLPTPSAGQYLPVVVETRGAGPVRRNYTISGYDNGRYRLTIKRECHVGLPPGLASNSIHAHWAVNHTIVASTPRGQFVLDAGSRRPILMLAGGIGITPLLAMLRELSVRDPQRRVNLVISVRHEADYAFATEIDALTQRMANLVVRIQCTARGKPILRERPAFGTGRISESLLRGLMSNLDTDVYLCGPASFMSAMKSALMTLGVHPSRLRFESFGPATLEGPLATDLTDEPLDSTVTFARSGISSAFDSRALSLLEFAEDLGVNLPFGCRSGTCGSCATRKLSGDIRYVVHPTVELEAGQILPCCAVPRGNVCIDA